MASFSVDFYEEFSSNCDLENAFAFFLRMFEIEMLTAVISKTCSAEHMSSGPRAKIKWSANLNTIKYFVLCEALGDF